MQTRVEISDFCGLCSGSQRAVDTALLEAKSHNNVVLFKQILHNKNTVQKLFDAGITQKDNLSDLSPADFVIIRAHGEKKDVYDHLKRSGISYVDCTCPNVAVINRMVAEKDGEGYKIILVGKYGYHDGKMHPEVLGTSGWCRNPIFVEEAEEVDRLDMSFKKYFLVVQTTFSMSRANEIISKIDAKMKENHKKFEFRKTMCGAQNLINTKSVELAKKVDKMIVIGGKNSNNTKELFENVKNFAKAYFAENVLDVKELILSKELVSGDYIGLTGGASTTMEEIVDIKNYILSNL